MTSALTGSTNRNLPIPGPFGAAAEYATDAAQRWVLFLDVHAAARQCLSRARRRNRAACARIPDASCSSMAASWIGR